MSERAFTNILVATDGSQSSRGAVERGVELAAAGRGRVTFLHVVAPVDHRATRLGSLPSTTWLDANDDRVLDDAWHVAYERDVEAGLERVAGEEATAIVAVADEIDADLIVIGRGRRRPLLRSVGRAVLRRSPRAVLVAQASRAA
jgi:nucleotide-binding universal stress UspA family protein